MSGPRKGSNIPGKSRINLDDVRSLELKYSRTKPDKMDLAVEYVGSRIKVFEVDRYLVERLLEQLENQGT
jgi:hypothetical protein